MINPDIQFLKLFFVNFGGAILHHISSHVIFGEGDGIAYRVEAGEKGDPSVETECDTSMGRGAVAEGIHQETKAVFSLFLRKSEYFEHFGLQLGVVNSDGATTNFYSVDYQVVSVRMNLAWIGIEQWNIRRFWCSKGVVHGVESLGFVVPFKQGKVDHPEWNETGLVEEIPPSAPLQAHFAQSWQCCSGFPGQDQQEVAGFSSGNLRPGL